MGNSVPGVSLPGITSTWVNQLEKGLAEVSWSLTDSYYCTLWAASSCWAPVWLQLLHELSSFRIVPKTPFPFNNLKKWSHYSQVVAYGLKWNLNCLSDNDEWINSKSFDVDQLCSITIILLLNIYTEVILQGILAIQGPILLSTK